MQDINFHSARFMLSAPTLDLCPPEIGAEVAFAGRSNAGKSSAINRLTNNGKLARTSKTPGRTQLINYFNLHNDDNLRLVDLPGYGYAKVSRNMKNEWQRHLSEYLHERRTLRGLVLLMDIRHPLQEVDTMLLNWAIEAEMPTRVLLTKSDKMKRGAAKNVEMSVRKQLKESNVEDLVSVQTFSSLKGDGVEALEKALSGWLSAPTQEETRLADASED